MSKFNFFATNNKNSSVHTKESLTKYINDTNTITGSASKSPLLRVASFIKKLLLWVLTFFLFVIAIACLPHFSGIIALLAIVVVIPIEKWQFIISRFINKRIKTIAVTVMTVLALFLSPSSPDSEAVDSGDRTIPLTETTEFSSLESTTAFLETMPSAVLEQISFEEGTVAVGIGRTVEIPFVLYPENAIHDTLEVSIDHGEFATVSLDDTGDLMVLVTGILPGEATITLKSGDTAIATKTISVEEIMPEEINIIASPQSPTIGTNGTFTVSFTPTDVTQKEITWQSDSPDVIQVNEDGSFDARSIGEATITATHQSGMTGTLLVTVIPVQVERVDITADWDENNLFYKNDDMQLTATVSPENATDTTITWTSNDESIATVSEFGVVKAITAGNATITATASNGVQAKYEITISPSPQKFRVSTSISMTSNDSVGSTWSKGFVFNGEELKSKSTVSIMPGDNFSAGGWAQENDKKPDYGSYIEKLALTADMCDSGFTIEGDAYVYENAGRYSGNCAVWHVKITFTPVD